MDATTTERSEPKARDGVLGIAVLGCGLSATLMHWAWFRGQGAPPLDLTIAIALLAATLAAVVARSWLAWSGLRAARRETDARMAELDRALARARRPAEAGGAGSDAEPRGATSVDDDLESMRREWLRDRELLEAMRGTAALSSVWRRKFGTDAPDPEQVLRLLDELVRAPGGEPGSRHSR